MECTSSVTNASKDAEDRPKGGVVFIKNKTKKTKAKTQTDANKQTKSQAKENTAAINLFRGGDYPVLGRLSARNVVVVVIGEV